MQDIIVNDDNYWMWKIVFDDASTLITLSNNRDGGIMCANLPYYSFFVYEVLHQLLHEYDDKDYFDKIGKYRNSLKIFSDKYAPSVRKMNGVREQHDHFFRKKLRIPFANRLDINYDLGIYFDIDGQIIYDTQMVGDSSINQYEFSNREAYSLGQKTGEAISAIYVKLRNYYEPEAIVLKREIHCCYYLDINTSREKLAFNPENDFDMNIYLLHMYSWLGYVRNVLNKELSPDNNWLIRMKFVGVYNIERGLSTLDRHYNGHKETPPIIHKIKDKGPGWRIKTYTKLRNCMMHYGLEQNEKCLLNFGNVKPNKPMYGLVDCCIENEAEPFFERLDLELDELYKLIGEEFHFNLKRLQHF